MFFYIFLHFQLLIIEKKTKPQQKIKKDKYNKIEKSNKTKKIKIEIKNITIQYIRENAEKHEPYLSRPLDRDIICSVSSF